MSPRVVEILEVPGVGDAIAAGDPVACARSIAKILKSGADRKEVVRTAALAGARHSGVELPPPHALPVFSAALDLAPLCNPPELPLLQACALAASEWQPKRLPLAGHTISGDELHLGLSFRVAVRAANVSEADSLFSGLLREGEERRLAGDVLFEVCEQDMAGAGHKLTFAVGSWRLGRALGWRHGSELLRPAVHLSAGTPQDLESFSVIFREVGRARLDLEMAARNAAPIDATSRNMYDIALGLGSDRLVADLIHGLKRGRTPAGYADLVAATGAERLIADGAALEPALFALAARFVLGFSRTAAHQLAVLQAARAVARFPVESLPEPVRAVDPVSGLRDLEIAIEEGDSRKSVALASGLVAADQEVPLARTLVRIAANEDAHTDGGHRLLYAAAAAEFAAVAPGPALASLAALLARAHKSRTVAQAL